MTSLDELQTSEHNALIHEFDCLARDKWGWCILGSGYEHLVEKRLGAGRALGEVFSAETLFMRSWPDRYLRGNNRFWAVEFKGPATISSHWNGHPRIRLEAYQYCLLRGLWWLTGMETMYVFLDADTKFHGWVVPIHQLPIEEMVETDRFHTWPIELQEKTRRMFKRFHADLPIDERSNPKIGSGDPFVAFNRINLEQVGVPLDVWFEGQGVQRFSKRERQSWEGKSLLTSWAPTKYAIDHGFALNRPLKPVEGVPE